MNKFSPILVSTAFVIFSASAMAATQTSKNIEIEVIEPSSAALVGTVVDGNIKEVKIETVKNNDKTDLGTLGIKSNGTSCALTFSTDNDFSLNHKTTNVALKKFSLLYGSNEIKEKTQIKVEKCAGDLSTLGFATYGDTPAVVAPGTYRDTATVTLTAE